MFSDNRSLIQHSSLSAVNLTDRQDPSLVGDLSCLYKYFLKEGYSATGMFLKCIQFLCEAFLDKNLSPAERVFKAYYCKTFLVEWRRNITHGSQFISGKCFKDVCCCVDGLIMYLLLLKKKFPDATVVSWHLGSDPNEQAYAFCRIGRNAGRRTNLNAISLANGLERINVKSALLDAEDTTSYAHTRGRSVLRRVVPLPGENEEYNNDVKIWHGKEINSLSIKCSIQNAINTCIKYCQKLNLPFFMNCDANANIMPRNLSNKVSIGCCGEDGYLSENDEDIEDEESEDSGHEDDEDDHQNSISTSYGNLHIKSAESIFLNGGRCTVGTKARKGRFYFNCFQESSPLEVFHKSEICCPKAITKGQRVKLKRFHDQSKFVKGTVQFMSSAHVPLKSLCEDHLSHTSVSVWVWSKTDDLYVRCSYP